MKKPCLTPSQVMPEQTSAQAFHQASSVQVVGSEKISPSAIWSIVLNEVTITT